jgi:kumamolisin
MKARMYQRKHVRSSTPAAKDYDFLRLPLTIDVSEIVRELESITLPWIDSLWKWHRGTSFCVLRAGPQGVLAGDELLTGRGVDAPILARLPRLRALLDGQHDDLPIRSPMAWIGRSPTRSTIRMHIDNTQHWDEHHRLHVPLVTTPDARLCVRGRFVHMAQGTAWAFNNSRPHGALNDGPGRLHLVLDVPPGRAIDRLFAAAESVNGALDPLALGRLSEDPLGDGGRGERPEVLARMVQQ